MKNSSLNIARSIHDGNDSNFIVAESAMKHDPMDGLRRLVNTVVIRCDYCGGIKRGIESCQNCGSPEVAKKHKLVTLPPSANRIAMKLR